MDLTELLSLYPKVNYFPERQMFLPWVPVPIADRETIRRFSESGYREELEVFAQAISQQLGREVRLIWNEATGRLRYTALGTHAGLVLEDDKTRFVVHNVEALEDTLPLMAIAVNYASLLLNSSQQEVQNNRQQQGAH